MVSTKKSVEISQIEPIVLPGCRHASRQIDIKGTSIDLCNLRPKTISTVGVDISKATFDAAPLSAKGKYKHK
jgi:hypothetical protein